MYKCRPTTRTKKVILALCLSLLLGVQHRSAHAGMCEEQLKIPWRQAVVDQKLPLNVAFNLNSDGTVGAGPLSAVIDRPFYNKFTGGVWILFTKSGLEMFVETNNQGYIHQCEFPALTGIAIDGKAAPLERVLTAKPYLNRTNFSHDAIRLIISSSGGNMEVLTNGRKFAVGNKSLSALKKLLETD
jgi:hypothetical protein